MSNLMFSLQQLETNPARAVTNKLLAIHDELEDAGKHCDDDDQIYFIEARQSVALAINKLASLV